MGQGGALVLSSEPLGLGLGWAGRRWRRVRNERATGEKHKQKPVSYLMKLCDKNVDK